jgi:hypothetical protein
MLQKQLMVNLASWTPLLFKMYYCVSSIMQNGNHPANQNHKRFISKNYTTKAFWPHSVSLRDNLEKINVGRKDWQQQYVQILKHLSESSTMAGFKHCDICMSTVPFHTLSTNGVAHTLLWLGSTRLLFSKLRGLSFAKITNICKNVMAEQNTVLSLKTSFPSVPNFYPNIIISVYGPHELF